MQETELVSVGGWELGESMWPFPFFQTGFPCVAQARLKLVLPRPQLPQCWDYKGMPHMSGFNLTFVASACPALPLLPELNLLVH